MQPVETGPATTIETVAPTPLEGTAPFTIPAIFAPDVPDPTTALLKTALEPAAKAVALDAATNTVNDFLDQHREEVAALEAQVRKLITSNAAAPAVAAVKEDVDAVQDDFTAFQSDVLEHRADIEARIGSLVSAGASGFISDKRSWYVFAALLVVGVVFCALLAYAYVSSGNQRALDVLKVVGGATLALMPAGAAHVFSSRPAATK